MPITSKTFKRLISILLALGVLFTGVTPLSIAPLEASASSTKKAPVVTPYIKPNASSGIVAVTIPPMKSGYSAYAVVESGRQDYSFKLDKAQNIPLPFGNGNYTVTLYQGKNDVYIQMERKTFLASFSTLTYAKQKTILSPGSQDAEVNTLMQKQFKDWKKWSAETKVKNVHAYLTKTYRYDEVLSRTAGDWYLPKASRLTQNKKGICYDFASLNASLLREMGIPTRIVMGYPKNVTEYHSWNEVYIDKSWKVVDTTFDIGLKKNSPYKSAKDYSKVYYRF